MKPIKEYLTEWAELREHGDVIILSKILQLPHALVSRTLNGHRKPKVGELEQINLYFSARKKSRLEMNIENAV